MSSAERIPLIPVVRNDFKTRVKNGDGYLLLSLSEANSEKRFIERVNRLGNRCGVLTAIIAAVVVVILIVGITYFADVSELVGGGGRHKHTTNVQQSPKSPWNGFMWNSKNKIVTTSIGSLKGYLKQSRQGRDYFAFYKVPYAKPPIGNLRFKPPQPAERWEGIRDFDHVAPECIQKSKYSFKNETIGEEDCLYANIYVPKTANDLYTLNYPVMVYIHGGGLGAGNGSRYGADYFMDENVVLVTFQYRLGILGFLSTGDGTVSGNMGFKDQVQLLKWVRQFIKSFGGNPDLVTIFGNSSGGFCVSFLVISPMGKGLFHRAISQSGTVFSEPGSVIDSHPERTKIAVAEAFNCSLESTKLLDCLQGQKATDLALIRSPEIMFGLTVEENDNAFMPEKPYDLMQAGKLNPVPYLIGVMSAEWIGQALGILASSNSTEAINNNFQKFAGNFLGMNLTFEEGELMKKFYFGDKAIGLETERNLTNLASDRMTVHGSKVISDFHSGFGNDVYLYHWAKPAKKSYSATFFELFPSINFDDAAAHADEIQFLFPYFNFPFYAPDDHEYFPFSGFIVKLWSYFGKTGKVDLNQEMENWHPVVRGAKDSFWFELNDHKKSTNVLQGRMDFWDQFSHKKLGYDF